MIGWSKDSLDINLKPDWGDSVFYNWCPAMPYDEMNIGKFFYKQPWEITGNALKTP